MRTRIFSCGRGPGEGRLRRKHSEGRNRAANGAGHLCGAESTRARIRRASRSGDEGAGYGDIEIKQAIEEEQSWAENFGATRAISTTGGYNLEGYAPELEMPK